MTLVGVGGSFLLVGVLSLVGHRSGAPALTVSRATFGQRGNLGPTVVAWAGTFAVDMTVRRHYDERSLLQRSAGSLYWYTRGIRLPAVVAWLAGIVAGASVTSLSLGTHLTISGPFHDSWLGRNNLGWLCAGVVSSILFACLGRESAPAAEPARARLYSGEAR